MKEKKYRDASLYLHYPFCVRKCRYCDFLSGPAGESQRQQYIDVLCREIRLRGEEVRKKEADSGTGCRIISLFIGGGTPSLMTAFQAEQVIEAVRSSFSLAENAECTMEVNPGTADRALLCAYHDLGINRISLGVQSLIDDELSLLGRIHTAEQAEKTYGEAVSAGFGRINLDLIFGLPGQKLNDWAYSLERASSWGAGHISAYSLQIEEGTPFYTMDLPPLPPEEEEREMYRLTESILADRGIFRYEISNYAAPGAECIHNIGYWTGRPYLGMGLGAASMWEGARFHGPRSSEKYRAAVEQGRIDALEEDKIILHDKDQMEEFMFLGLRLMRGVSSREFLDRFGVSLEQTYGDVLRRQLEEGLLVREQERYHLTEYGLDIANTVMAEYLF